MGKGLVMQKVYSSNNKNNMHKKVKNIPQAEVIKGDLEVRKLHTKQNLIQISMHINNISNLKR